MKRLWVAAAFALFLGLTALATVGCSWFDDSPTTVTIAGASGADCTEDWQCQSNSCVYPGRCQ